jgi:hypothetical protein
MQKLSGRGYSTLKELFRPIALREEHDEIRERQHLSKDFDFEDRIEGYVAEGVLTIIEAFDCGADLSCCIICGAERGSKSVQ